MEHKFGKYLKEIRLKKGYTLREVGERAEINFSYLWQIENGKRTASLNTVFALSNALRLADKREQAQFIFCAPRDIAPENIKHLFRYPDPSNIQNVYLALDANGKDKLLSYATSLLKPQGTAK